MTPDGMTNLGAAVNWANRQAYVPLQIRYGMNPRTDRIDGWRVLVISILLNRTARRQVQRVLPLFFDAFGFAVVAECATYSPFVHEAMEAILTSLGFGHTRTQRIAFMSKEWLDHEDWHDSRSVQRFTGCGTYAQDAFRIFVEHDYLTPLASADRVLLAWQRHMALQIARSAV